MRKEEYFELIQQIQRHDRLYYIEARPVITDHEYDKLLKRVEEIERHHPDWISPISPTQRVSESPTKGFVQVEHAVPMLSLANTYSKEEVGDFISRIHKLLDHKKIHFCCELKMDGMAITARYEKGVFVRAVTRGDGKKGDDITANMKTVRLLPLKLSGDDVPDILEVRGEVYMLKKVFQQLNTQKEQEGDDLWANPRNATAGSLKLLDPKEVAKRKLSVVFYSIAEESDLIASSQHECSFLLRKWGLPAFAQNHVRVCDSEDEIMDFANEIEKHRDALPFDIDGVVIKLDERKYHDMIGSTGKSPRFAVAYKFAPEQVETKVNDITVQVGRTGVLTPVAELNPVPLAGSTICRATLHNEEEVQRKDVRIGDVVIIEKGGDVIPKVVQVVMEKRTHSSPMWKMPATCPSCGCDVVHAEGEVAIRCPNHQSCPDQVIRKIVFFASKDAMDIGHLGEKVVQQLVNKGFISRVSDIYALTEKEIAQLEGFKEKSINNLLGSIDKSRNPTLARLILALGIKYVGEGTAEALAETAGDIETLSAMTKQQLENIEGVGEKVADAVVEYFQNKANREELVNLLQKGVSPKKIKKAECTDHPFFGKTFVLTGTLSKFTRSAASDLIKERGGKVCGSVSQSTDFLLAGEEAGSKLDKAKKLKVAILSEDMFIHML